jgi:dTDP-4-amino-4,6-dideoxygalactose transaminase
MCQMQDLETRLARRRASYQALKAGLGACLYSVPGDQAPLHNIVFTKIPAQLIEALRQRGIQAAQPYRTISRHPVYAHLAGGGFPNADQWNDHAVYLPFGMGLDPADAERIVAAVHQSGVPLQSCG